MFKTLIKSVKNNKTITKILEQIVYLFMRLLYATYRITIINEPHDNKHINAKKGIFYAWHQNIIATSAFLFKNKSHMHCIVSPSQDGRFVGALTEKLGLKVLYGSAHKDPIKLVRNSIKILQKEGQLFLIGDGSRGPAKKLQQGATYLAKKTNLPIIFIECNTKWKITLKKTWDKFQIPVPFSKIEITIYKIEKKEKNCLHK